MARHARKQSLAGRRRDIVALAAAVLFTVAAPSAAWDDVQIEPDEPAPMRAASVHEAGTLGYWVSGSLRAALLAPDGTPRRLDVAGNGTFAETPDGELLEWLGPGRACSLARHGVAGLRWSASLAATCDRISPTADGGAWGLVRGTSDFLPRRLVRWSDRGAVTVDLPADTLGGRDFARSIASSPDGGVLVVVYAEAEPAARLIRLSPSGQAVWSRAVSVGAGGVIATRRLLAHPDGSFLLEAYEELAGDLDATELQSFDGDGQLRWRWSLGPPRLDRPLRDVTAIEGGGWGIVADQGAPGAPEARWVGRLLSDGSAGPWQQLGDDEQCVFIDDREQCGFAVDADGTLLVSMVTGSAHRVRRIGATGVLPDVLAPAGGWAPIIGLAATGGGDVVVLDAPLNALPRMFTVQAASAATRRPDVSIEDAGTRRAVGIDWFPTGAAWTLSVGGVSGRSRLTAHAPAGGRQWVVELPGEDNLVGNTTGAVSATDDRVCTVRYHTPFLQIAQVLASCHARADGRALWTRRFDGFIEPISALQGEIDPVDGSLLLGATLKLLNSSGERVVLFRLHGTDGATVAQTMTPLAPRWAFVLTRSGAIAARSGQNQATRFFDYDTRLQIVREVAAGDDRPVDSLLATDRGVIALGRPWTSFEGQELSSIDLSSGSGWRLAFPELGRGSRMAASGDRVWLAGVSGTVQSPALFSTQIDWSTGLESWRRSEPFAGNPWGIHAVDVAASRDGRHVFLLHSEPARPLRLRMLDVANGSLVQAYEAEPLGALEVGLSAAAGDDGALRALVATELPGGRERPALVRLDVPGQTPLLRNGFEPAAN